jgi:hypothetical protein
MTRCKTKRTGHDPMQMRRQDASDEHPPDCRRYLEATDLYGVQGHADDVRTGMRDAGHAKGCREGYDQG